jgi:O-antigen/teichoic acid export membrane protein
LFTRLSAFVYQRMPLISGFAATGISMLLGLIGAPIYINLLGIESYGLVGFYITLQATLQVFDFGISPTIMRELSRYSVELDGVRKSRDLIRSLEVIYWLIGILITILLLILAPLLSSGWLNAKNISPDTLSFSILAIVGLVFIQWPLSFYQGALMGLNRQTLANSIVVIFTALRFSVSLGVLSLIESTLKWFFISQTICSFLQIITSIVAVWLTVPKSGNKPKFSPKAIRGSASFSAGVGGINVLGLLLTQMDRIVLSKLLPLEQFGYYTLASTVGRSVSIVISPVFNYVFPKFSTLVATNDQKLLSLTYHRSTQLMTVITMPLSLTIAFFSPQILEMWTHNPAIVDNASQATSILVVGTGFNSLMITPYILHLAYGQTRRWFLMTMGFAGILLTLLVIIAPNFGMLGASFVWLLLNSLQILVAIPLTRFYLLPKENVFSLFSEVVVPTCMSAILLFFMYGLKPLDSLLIPYILFVYCLSTVLSILLCSDLRRLLFTFMVSL